MMIEEWKARIIRALGGVVPEKSTFVVDAEIERSEELRVDRLGLTEEDMDGEEREVWTPPVDPWRPRNTLGPL